MRDAIFFVGAIFADAPDAIKMMFTVPGILPLAWLVYSFVYREKVYVLRMRRQFVWQTPRFLKREKKSGLIRRCQRATPSAQTRGGMKTTFHKIRTLDLVLTDDNMFLGPKLKHVEPGGKQLADEIGIGLVISDLTGDGRTFTKH